MTGNNAEKFTHVLGFLIGDVKEDNVVISLNDNKLDAGTPLHGQMHVIAGVQAGDQLQFEAADGRSCSIHVDRIELPHAMFFSVVGRLAKAKGRPKRTRPIPGRIRRNGVATGVLAEVAKKMSFQFCQMVSKPHQARKEFLGRCFEPPESKIRAKPP
jgi:hypothetical protein